jgi:hypothetical protein
MPFRRQFLAALGTGGAAGLAGCSATRDLFYAEGRVQFKVLSLAWEAAGRRWRDEPLRLLFDRGDGHVYGRYDPAYVENAVRAPDDVVLTRDVHDRLAARFDAVEYVLGFCSESLSGDPGDSACRNSGVDRSGFSRVQMGDHARVVHHGTEYDVLDVLEDVDEVRTTDVREFSFQELHADHGVPDPPQFE